ncbi:MAG: 50S ribosomal protein L31e [Candidatus Anstonellales archaeon]
MVEKVERVYTINFGGIYDYPRRVRAKKAISYLREFVARHAKADIDSVMISPVLNSAVWRDGIEKPPRRLKIKVVKEGEQTNAYLFGEEEMIAETKKRREKKRKESDEKRKKRATKKEESKTAEVVEKTK